MKKQLISSTILLIFILQILSFANISFGFENSMPQIFQQAICNDENFIDIVDEATENDNYVNNDAIVVEANSSAVINNGEYESLSDNASAIMYEDELYVPV